VAATLSEGFRVTRHSRLGPFPELSIPTAVSVPVQDYELREGQTRHHF
jgi:hypothetical protein